MAAKVGTVIIDIKADTAKLTTGMDKAEKKVKNGVAGMQKAILGMAAAYAGLSSVRAFNGMISETLDAADAAGKLSQKLGLTSKTLSEYQYAAGFAAVSQGELSGGLNALIRRLNNFQRTGGGAGKKGFETLGISAEYARENFKTTDDAFKEILKRLEKMPDGYKKTAAAQDIFSKSASGILRLTATDLEKFSEEAERIGISIPEGVAQMAAIYHDEMDKLDARFKGISNTVSESFLPAMLAASQTAVSMYDETFGGVTDQMDAFESVSIAAIENVVYGIGFMVDAWTGVKVVLKTIEVGAWTMARGVEGAINLLMVPLNSMIDGYNAIADVTGSDKMQNIILDNFGDDLDQSVLELNKLVGSLEDGRIKADEFVLRFNKNLKENKKNIEGSTKAQDSLNGAIETVIGTTDKEIKAQRDLADNMEYVNDQILKATGSDYDKWLEGINKTMRSMAAHGATEVEMMIVFDAEKAKRDMEELLKGLPKLTDLGVELLPKKEDVKVEFESWGRTLNSSISNSLVNAIQSGDVKSAISGLSSSISASMIQASTANLLAGGAQLSAAGGAMSMGGVYGIAAGVGLSLVSDKLFGEKVDPMIALLAAIDKKAEARNKTLESQLTISNLSGREGDAILAELGKSFSEMTTTLAKGLIDSEVYRVDSTTGQKTGVRFYNTEEVGQNMSTLFGLITEGMDRTLQGVTNGLYDVDGALTTVEAGGQSVVIAFEDLNSHGNAVLKDLGTAIIELGTGALQAAYSVNDAYDTIRGLYEELSGDLTAQKEKIVQAQKDIAAAYPVSRYADDPTIDNFTKMLKSIVNSGRFTEIEKLTDDIDKNLQAAIANNDELQNIDFNAAGAEEALKLLRDAGFEDIAADVDRLNTILGDTGYTADMSVNELINLKDEIELIAKVAQTSKDNIKTWEDSFKTQDELILDMAKDLNHVNWATGDLQSTYAAMIDDADGLTDAELALLQARQDAEGTIKDLTQAWIDSNKTQQELAADMARDLGVGLARNLDELDNLFDDLSSSGGSLTQAEYNLLDANRALINAREAERVSMKNTWASLLDNVRQTQAAQEEAARAASRAATIAFYTKNVESAQARLDATKDTISGLNSAVSTATSDKSSLESAIKSTQSGLQSIANQIAATKASIVTEQQKRAIEAQNAAITAHNDSINARITATEATKSALTSQISEIESSRSGIESAISTMASQLISQAEAVVSGINSQISEAQSARDSVQSALESMASSLVSQAQTAHDDIENQVSVLEDQRDTQIAALEQQKKDSISTVITDLNSTLSELSSSMSALDSLSNTLRSRFLSGISTQSGFEAIRNAARGATLNPNDPSSVTAYNTAISEYDQVASSYITPENFANKYDYQYAKASTNADFAGFATTVDANIAALENIKAAVENDVSVNQSSLDELNYQTPISENDLAVTQSQLENMQAQLATAENNLAAITAQMDPLIGTEDASMSAFYELKKQLVVDNTQLDKLKAQLATAEDSLTAITAQMDPIVGTKEASIGSLHELQDQLAVDDQQLTNLKSQLTTADASLIALQAQIQPLLNTETAQKDSLKQLEDQLAEQQASYATQQQQLAQQQSDYAQASEALASAQSSLAAQENIFEQQTAELAKAQENLDAVKAVEDAIDQTKEGIWTLQDIILGGIDTQSIALDGVTQAVNVGNGDLILSLGEDLTTVANSIAGTNYILDNGMLSVDIDGDNIADIGAEFDAAGNLIKIAQYTKDSKDALNVTNAKMATMISDQYGLSKEQSQKLVDIYNSTEGQDGFLNAIKSDSSLSRVANQTAAGRLGTIDSDTGYLGNVSSKLNSIDGDTGYLGNVSNRLNTIDGDTGNLSTIKSGTNHLSNIDSSTGSLGGIKSGTDKLGGVYSKLNSIDVDTGNLSGIKSGTNNLPNIKGGTDKLSNVSSKLNTIDGDTGNLSGIRGGTNNLSNMYSSLRGIDSDTGKLGGISTNTAGTKSSIDRQYDSIWNLNEIRNYVRTTDIATGVIKARVIDVDNNTDSLENLNGRIRQNLSMQNQRWPAGARSAISYYADGGWTGPGTKYQPAGIVHSGEVVFSQANNQQWGGWQNVEALRTGGLQVKVDTGMSSLARQFSEAVIELKASKELNKALLVKLDEYVQREKRKDSKERFVS